MTTADVTNTEKTSVSTHRHAEVAEDTDDVGNDNDQTEPSSELLEEGGNNASAVAASSPEELEDVDEDEGGDEEEGAAGGDDLPAGLDGDDDKTSKQHFTELLKAFSAKNSPLLGFEVGKDICRRLTNLYDRGLVHGNLVKILIFDEIRIKYQQPWAKIRFHGTAYFGVMLFNLCKTLHGLKSASINPAIFSCFKIGTARIDDSSKQCANG